MLETNFHDKGKKKANLKIACNPRESMCPVSRGKEGKHLQHDFVWSLPRYCYVLTFGPTEQAKCPSQKSQSPGSWMGLQETTGILHPMALTLRIHHGPCLYSELMAQSIF